MEKNPNHHYHKKYLLRLTNSAVGNEAPILNADKSKATIIIPGWLRKKGACNVRVIDMNISLKNGSGTSVVPANTHIVALGVQGLPMLGWSNETNTIPQILGTGIIQPQVNAVKLESSSALEFTCLELPSQLTLERKCYSPTTGKIIDAKEFTTTVVPYQVDLELIFFEDD